MFQSETSISVESFSYILYFLPYCIQLLVFSTRLNIIKIILSSSLSGIPLTHSHCSITTGLVIFGEVYVVFFHVSYITALEFMNLDLFLCFIYFISAVFFPWKYLQCSHEVLFTSKEFYLEVGKLAWRGLSAGL